MLPGGIREGEKWFFSLHKPCFCHGPKAFSAFPYTLGVCCFYGLNVLFPGSLEMPEPNETPQWHTSPNEQLSHNEDDFNIAAEHSVNYEV